MIKFTKTFCVRLPYRVRTFCHSRTLQACEVATEAHICRYVMQYHRAIEIGIQQAVRTPGDTTYVGADDAEHTDDGAVKGWNVGDRESGLCSFSRDPRCREVIRGVVEGIQNQCPGFVHLEDAVER